MLAFSAACIKIQLTLLLNVPSYLSLSDNWVQVGSKDSRCGAEFSAQASATNVADKAAFQKQAESYSAQASWLSLSENTTVNNSARGFSHPYWCFNSKTCNEPKNSSVDLPSGDYSKFSDYLQELKPSWKRFSNANASGMLTSCCGAVLVQPDIKPRLCNKHAMHSQAFLTICYCVSPALKSDSFDCRDRCINRND